VSVESSFRVPNEIDQLRFDVRGIDTGAEFFGTFPLSLPFPHALRLAPAGSTSEGVQIIVSGLFNRDTKVRRVVTDRFVSGEVRSVRVFLDPLCLDVICGEGVDCRDGECVVVTPDGGLDGPDATDATVDVATETMDGSDSASSDALFEGDCHGGVMIGTCTCTSGQRTCVHEDAFATADSLSTYVGTGTGSCAPQVSGGALRMGCAADGYSTATITGLTVSPTGTLHLEYDLTTSSWGDEDPLLGVFLSGTLGSYYLTLSGHVVTGCSRGRGRTCLLIVAYPTGVAWPAGEQLRTSTAGPGSGVTYRIVVDVTPADVALIPSASGAPLDSLAASDSRFRDLAVSLVCSEAECVIDNLRVVSTDPI